MNTSTKLIIDTDHILNTLNESINKGEINIDFEFKFDYYEKMLDIFWYESMESTEKEFHLTLKTTYTSINDENGFTADLDTIDIIELTYGDSYDNEGYEFSAIDVQVLAKTIENMFDKHNENKGYDEDGFAMNLIK